MSANAIPAHVYVAGPFQALWVTAASQQILTTPWVERMGLAVAVVEGGTTGTLELTEENVEIVLDEVCTCSPVSPIGSYADGCYHTTQAS
jgi:hypothetical protein